MPCLMLPGTWAVDRPWPRDTPDTRDVLKASWKGSRLLNTELKHRRETSLKRLETASSVTGSWVQRSSQRKALLPLHIKHPFSATHTGTDTHGPAPQRAGQWNRHRREQEIFSSFPNAKLREYKTHIQFACELTFL